MSLQDFRRGVGELAAHALVENGGELIEEMADVACVGALLFTHRIGAFDQDCACGRFFYGFESFDGLIGLARCEPCFCEFETRLVECGIDAQRTLEFCDGRWQGFGDEQCFAERECGLGDTGIERGCIACGFEGGSPVAVCEMCVRQ